MKRLIIIVGIVALNFTILSGQFSGDGTSATPYTGTITSSVTWYPDTYPNRTIYALNITVPSGVTLIISPGLYFGGKVIFSPYSPTRALTINSGGAVIINPNIGLTVNRIINDGTLTLESNDNELGVASLIHDSYSGAGAVQVKLYLSGGTTTGGAYKWHYISVPITNINVSTFNTLNLAQYIESLVAGPDNYPGWVAYDGYQYSTGSTLAQTFSILALGKGYNYYSASGNLFTLTGTINTYEFSEDINLTCGSGYTDYQGYNLIGNPFASCLNWDYMVDNGYTGAAYDAIYFTLNGTIASYINGVGSDGGTGAIPPMQGFFVKTNSNTSLVFPRAARVHDLEQMRYKKGPEEYEKGSDTISFIRLKLQDSKDSTDLVIRFNSKATTGVDKEFDAYEFSKTLGDINIWTSTGGIAFSINGLPFPESTIEIPVGVNAKMTSTFRLSSNEINKLDDYSIILKDKLTGKIIDLKKGEYCEFTSQTGSSENRFIVVVTKSATGVQDITTGSEEKFAIYRFGDAVNIRYDGEGQGPISGSVIVYDISGKMILKLAQLEWSGKGDNRQVSLESVSRGIYLIEVKTKDFRTIEKIVL